MPAETVLRNAENKALEKADSQSFYSGTGRSTQPEQKGKSPKKKRGSIYALVAILLSIVMFCTGIGSSHTLLGPGLTDHLTKQILDTGWSYNSNRYVRVFNDLASGKKVHGALGSLDKVSDWMKGRLSANQNFEVSGDSISWKGQNLNGGNVVALAESSPEFRSDFEGAVGGRILSTQDNTNSKMLKTKFGVSGNAYEKFKSTGDTDTDTANAKKIAAEQFEGKTSSRITTTEDKTVKEVDEEGNETGVETLDKNLQKNTAESVDNMSVDKIQAATDYINKVTTRVSKVVNYSCTIFRIGTIIATGITGVAFYKNSRQLLSNFLEPISKMMAGDGSESPINETYNRMTTPYADQTIEDYTTATASGSLGDAPDCVHNCNTQGNLTVSYGTHTYGNLSLVESPNVQAVLTETPYNSTAAAMNSLFAALEVVIKVLKGFQITQLGCILTQAAVASTQLTMTVASVAISLLPGGQIISAAGSTSLIWNAFVRWAVSLFAGVTLNFALDSFASFLIPRLANTFFDNPENDTKGVPEGERLVAAAGAVGSQMSRRNNGGGPITKEQAIAYNKLNQTTIAREAEVDRLNRSPFDTSSPNTFFGSLAYTFFPMTLSSGVTPVKTLVNTTSSAIASLTNSASADGEGSSYLTTFGNYEYMNEGFVNEDATAAADNMAVDIFGNPIIANDLSTLDIPIDDQYYNDLINSQVECTSETECHIKEKTELSYYTRFCIGRDSPFGVSDASILNELEYSSTLPVIGDITDILNATNFKENNEWATGRKCAAALNPEWETKYKYYQLYAQDSRIAAQMGNNLPGEEGVAHNNPIADHLEEYEKSRDDEGSYAKYIARVSGLSEEDATGLLAVAEYYLYLNSYDPDTRLAFDGKSTALETSAEISAHFGVEKEDKPAAFFTQLATIWHHAIYADVRNRSYAV